jgi:hypothetical protein
MDDAGAYPGEVDAGSPIRICPNESHEDFDAT